MKRLIILLIFLNGCSTLQTVATSKETFAACRTVDVATTLAIIHGGGHELNPLMAPLVAHPLAFIAFNVGLVYWVWTHWDQMGTSAKVTLNTAGCIAVPHNLGQL